MALGMMDRRVALSPEFRLPPNGFGQFSALMSTAVTVFAYIFSSWSFDLMKSD